MGVGSRRHAKETVYYSWEKIQGKCWNGSGSYDQRRRILNASPKSNGRELRTARTCPELSLKSEFTGTIADAKDGVSGKRHQSSPKAVYTQRKKNTA